MLSTLRKSLQTSAPGFARKCCRKNNITPCARASSFVGTGVNITTHETDRRVKGAATVTVPQPSYRLVGTVDGRLIAHDFTAEQLLPAFEVRGFEFTGYEFNPRLRPELRGQPVFSGLCGPMYGGEGIIRYETPKGLRHSFHMSAPQTDMFSGGDTGGDVLFNLQGQTVDAHAASWSLDAELDRRAAVAAEKKAQTQLVLA